MNRRPGEIPEAEEALLGIVRPTPEEEEEAAKRANFKRDARIKFLANLMEQPLFREWLMEKLNAFGAFENAFGNSPTGFPDPLATWFKAGMKSAGWALWEEFDDAAPELASRMRRAAKGVT